MRVDGVESYLKDDSSKYKQGWGEVCPHMFTLIIVSIGCGDWPWNEMRLTSMAMFSL